VPALAPVVSATSGRPPIRFAIEARRRSVTSKKDDCVTRCGNVFASTARPAAWMATRGIRPSDALLR